MRVSRERKVRLQTKPEREKEVSENSTRPLLFSALFSSVTLPSSLRKAQYRRRYSPPYNSVPLSHILQVLHQLEHGRVAELEVLCVDREKGETCSLEEVGGVFWVCKGEKGRLNRTSV